MTIGLANFRARARVFPMFAVPIPPPSPNPDITTWAQWRDAFRTSNGNETLTVAPGTYAGFTSADIPARDMRAANLTFACHDRDNHPLIAGTGNNNLVNLQGWQGLRLNGIDFYHDEVGVPSQANLGLLHIRFCTDLIIENCTISGSNVPHSSVSHNIRGIHTGSTRTQVPALAIIIRYNKIKNTADAINIGNPNGVEIIENFFTGVDNDCCVFAGNTTNSSFVRNLATEFQNFDTYRHRDLIQVLAYTGNSAQDQVEDYVNGVLIADNLVACYDDERRNNNGIHTGTSNQPVNNSGIQVLRNKILGNVGNGIIANNNGGPGNSWTDNVVGPQRDDGIHGVLTYNGGATSGYSLLRFQGGATGIYARNFGSFLAVDPNMVDGGGNVNAMQYFSRAQILAEMAVFRLLNPRIPF